MRPDQSAGPLLAPVLIGLAVLTGCGSDSGTDSGTLTGTVMDQDGGPLASCSITVVATSGVGEPIAEKAAITAADGSFSWELPTGTYEVTAICADRVTTVVASLDAAAETYVEIVVE